MLPIGKFFLKPFDEKDLPLCYSWVKQTYITKWWWEYESWDEFCNKHSPTTLRNNYVFPFIAYLDGTPVGFIQYYLAEKTNDGWWCTEASQPKNTFGIDLFIGNTNYLGKGYGRLLLQEFVTFLCITRHPSKIILNPNPSNIVATKCFEKAGFTRGKELITPEGPVVLMEFIPHFNHEQTLSCGLHAEASI